MKKAAKKKEEERDENGVRRLPQMYDPTKRDPQYAGAEASCLWEAVSTLHRCRSPKSDAL